MNKLDKILTSREERILNIKKTNCEKIIISIKANIPGENKNIKESYVLLRIFKKIIDKEFYVLKETFFESYDGPYYLLVIDNNNEKKVKQMMIELEESHQLGRFIDLDVYGKNKNNISRQIINYPKRKCMLCDNDAFYCIRLKKHSYLEIISHISLSVEEYLVWIIKDYLKQSFILELDLHPKFGLVTPFSNGSHQDMDYELMVLAQEAIIPGLMKMFLVGYKCDDLLKAFEMCRQIGLDTENDMLFVTKGINAYKGAIFIQGLVMLSLGYLLQKNLTYNDLYLNIISISQNLLLELENKPITDGLKMYNLYKIGGARKEAYLGLPNVRNAVKLLNTFEVVNSENLLMVLVEIIKNCEDTVMLKRSQSWDRYLYFKNLISSIDEYNYSKINEISEEFIKENISCGGSADLLITSVFIKFIFGEFID